jgi:hypothetical protein
MAHQKLHGRDDIECLVGIETGESKLVKGEAEENQASGCDNRCINHSIAEGLWEDEWVMLDSGGGWFDGESGH